MKQSTPRTFTGLAKSGHKRAAVNSGILSNSGKGNHTNKAAPSPAGGGNRNKADTKCLAKALNVPKKKSLPKSGVTGAAKTQKYALNHGEK